MNKPPVRLFQALFLCLVMAVIGRVAYRSLVVSDGMLEKDSEAATDLMESRIDGLVNKQDIFYTENSVSYDFNTMIALVETARDIKRQTKHTFETGSRSHLVDPGVLDLLLKRLYAEKVRLRNYIWDLKGHLQTGIPTKYNRKLRYYIQVLEEAIVSMRDVQRGAINQVKDTEEKA